MANTVSKRVTVTNPYAMAVPVIVAATEAQKKARQYDGHANFQELLLPVVVLGGEHFPETDCIAAAQAFPDLIALTQLRTALEKQDDYAAHEALEKLLAIDPTADGAQQFRSVPQGKKRVSIIALFAPGRVILPRIFTEKVSQARLVLWRRSEKTDKQFWPAVYCPDLKTALFARAALRDLLCCPSCDKAFRPERPDQQYCSLRCRERFRQRRRRANLLPRTKGSRKVKRHGHL